MIRRFWGWLWRGCLCPRCKVERTGYWTRYVTGVPFDEYICDTCLAVEQINLRAHFERWSR
jgi:hypothetical protein